MAVFKIFGQKDAPNLVTFSFSKYKLQDTAAYIESILADPEFTPERDTGDSDIPDLAANIDEHLREWSYQWMLHTCFKHLRDNGALTGENDSFIFAGWRRYLTEQEQSEKGADAAPSSS